MQNSDSITEQIISNPLFLKLKDVIENNPWHDNESVYDHLLKTYTTAKKQIEADFITDENAKKSFLDFVNEELDKVKIKDLMLITALIHDIGKILYYKDENQEKPLRHENSEGITKMPGHEYWGSTIVKEFVKDTSLSEKVIGKIAKVIRLHDTFNEGYFKGAAKWTTDALVDDVKARAEGFYKEALFNVYCDCYTAKPFEKAKEKIVEIFNEPSLYSPREYFIK